jgi:hypothetical protein
MHATKVDCLPRVVDSSNRTEFFRSSTVRFDINFFTLVRKRQIEYATRARSRPVPYKKQNHCVLRGGKENKSASNETVDATIINTLV